MTDTNESYARSLDAADPLRGYRDSFHIPTVSSVFGREGDETTCVYLTGNSLGLQPRGVRAAIEQELLDWERLGVEGHLLGKNPWLPYHESLRGPLSRLVGASEREVVAMNSLTVNLHLLMVSFYRPATERYRIIIEDSAFPSDSYAVGSQAAFHGIDAGSAVVRLRPREGEATLRTEDIVAAIEREGPRLALVMLGGVNYLTGQWFDMPAVTGAAKRVGAMCGWDLAHAAGNVPLRLHDWGVDFAVWCSYKYLNSGPGAIAGAFVHERHLSDATLPQFAGWWGNDPGTRFEMGPSFTPVARADRWALSNPPIFSLTPVRVSLELFDKAGMEALRVKSVQLTGYLEGLLSTLTPGVRIVTPRDPNQRGCQLSLRLPGDPKRSLDALKSAGVVCDFRSPDIIRAAPVPLYSTYHDVWRFVKALASAVGR
ncbi:MAG: kynureninase [Phycisphaerae bacterium]|nr:kynureninase [Phycisphaerae bacterium]